MKWIGKILIVALLQQPDAETRVVNYLKANVRRGEPVEVSRLVNDVFKTPEEQRVLQRLFNTFFKIPMAIVEFQAKTGRIPRLQELSDQFHFNVPGEMDLMLRIMEADPRIPKFLTRNTTTGEITRIDVNAIRKEPRFGQNVERTIAGWLDDRPAGGHDDLIGAFLRPAVGDTLRGARAPDELANYRRRLILCPDFLVLHRRCLHR